MPKIKEVLTENWHIIQNQPLLRETVKDPPIIFVYIFQTEPYSIVKPLVSTSKYSTVHVYTQSTEDSHRIHDIFPHI